MKYSVSMARTYVQDARAEAAAAKRLQVLDAAIDMLASEPLPRVTLEAVARRAGAARRRSMCCSGRAPGCSTRWPAGCWSASASTASSPRWQHRIPSRRCDRRCTSPCASTPNNATPPARRGHGPISTRTPPAPSQCSTAAARSGTAHLVSRLAAAGRLRPGVSPDEAADVLYVLTSFDTFDQLFTERRLAPDTVERRLRLLLGSIVSV